MLKKTLHTQCTVMCGGTSKGVGINHELDTHEWVFKIRDETFGFRGEENETIYVYFIARRKYVKSLTGRNHLAHN